MPRFLLVLLVASMVGAGCSELNAPRLENSIELTLQQSGDAQLAAKKLTPGAQRYEIDFLTTMIDHHAMAVEMATLCDERTTNAELLTLCGSIRTAQAEEIEMLQGWLSSWYGITHEPELSDADRAALEDLGVLRRDAFETEFLTMMIDHHAQALREVRQCDHRAFHADLVVMCAEMESAQSAEIATMTRWLCDWHEVCGRHPHSD